MNPTITLCEARDLIADQFENGGLDAKTKREIDVREKRLRQAGEDMEGFMQQQFMAYATIQLRTALGDGALSAEGQLQVVSKATRTIVHSNHAFEIADTLDSQPYSPIERGWWIDPNVEIRWPLSGMSREFYNRHEVFCLIRLNEADIIATWSLPTLDVASDKDCSPNA